MTGRHRAVECDVIPAKVWEAVGTFRSNYIWSMHIDNGTLVDARVHSERGAERRGNGGEGFS